MLFKRLLVALTMSLPLFARAAQDRPKGLDLETMNVCSMLLNAVPLDQYLPAIQVLKLDKTALHAAEKKMMSHVIRSLSEAANDMVGMSRMQLQGIVQSLSQSISARVLGIDQQSDVFLQKALEQFPKVASRLKTAVIAAAEDPEVYRAFSMAPFILQGKASIETVLMKLRMHPDMQTLEFITAEHDGQFVSSPLSVGPRQIEMVRTVLQYSNTRPGDRVLEIGYGTPDVALGFSLYTDTRVTALDRRIPADNANPLLATYNVQLLHGQFPDSIGVALSTKGAFRVIMALDTIKADTDVLITSTAPEKFAQALYEQLTDGGTLVIVNDFAGQPYFTRQQAEAAGFRVIRWGVNQYLPAGLIKLMPYHPNQVNAGILATYVLRKGEVSFDAYRTVKSKAK